ncbi:DUF6007 family protein [Staphylococcus pettenkoferi]|uniref:DUF6007 family protein n=2 Tax=Staphylococcus pettenkoferi TaxID=170573 RepID=UPI002DD44D07|nr:DUF6007 family protein [Staphylococcus pettenkoferi]
MNRGAQVMDNIEEVIKNYFWIAIISIIPMSLIMSILPTNTFLEILISLVTVILSSIGLSTIILYIIYIYQKKK